MKTHELLGIVPLTAAPPAVEDISFCDGGAYTAVLRTTPRPVMSLPQSRKQVLIETARRQLLLEHCMPSGPIIPVRPRFFLSKQKVGQFVCANAPLLDQLTQRLDHQVQFQITVTWDPGKVLAHFRNSAELSPLFNGPTVTPAQVQKSVANLARRLHATIHAMVADVATDIAPLPHDEDVIFNAAVMVPDTGLTGLDQAVLAIDSIWSEGFHIKQIGPSPAASFVLLDPVLVSSHDIAHAYELLALGDRPSDAAIKDARRRALLAAPEHAQSLRQSASIVAAASRLGDTRDAFFLCSVRSETGSDTPQYRAVA